MTKASPRLLRYAGVAALLLAAAFVGRLAFRPAAPGLREQIEATAEPSRTDRMPEIVLHAGASGFRPNVVYSPAGIPLRIVVRAVPGGGGPDRLLVPDLGVAADLAAEGDTLVSVPAGPRGAFPITDRTGNALGALRFH